MGSVGDAWDQYIVIPEEQLQAEQQRQNEVLRQKANRKPKRRNAQDVVFLEWMPELHNGVVVSWVFVGLALASVGPLNPIMPFMAMIAFLAGVTTLFLLKTVHTKENGFELGLAATITGFVLIFVSSLAPMNKSYRTFAQTTLSAQAQTLTQDQKIQRAQADMQLLADAAHCAYLLLGDEITGVGRESVNGVVEPDSISFRISSIATKPEREFRPLELENVYIWNKRFPKDPFSDDSRATFGVAIVSGAILVYSPGPDGKWQINPRRPVDRTVDDYTAFFAPQTYTPLTGEGDLILIRPLTQGGFMENSTQCLQSKANWEAAWFNQ